VAAATQQGVEDGITITAWQRESRKETLWMLRERGEMLVQINISRFSLSLSLSVSLSLSLSLAPATPKSKSCNSGNIFTDHLA
jgi:hypothetical protein